MSDNLLHNKSAAEKSADNNIEQFFEKTVNLLHDGELIKGKVLCVTRDEVVVDIGYKSEGRIPIKEFLNAKHGLQVKAGDEIEVLLENSDDDKGYVVLSKEKADRIKMRGVIEEAANTGKAIEGRIAQKIKGGFNVDLKGITAFLPGSQTDIRPVNNPDKLIDNFFMFKVLQYDRQKPNIVVSRRAILEEERERNKKDILQTLEEGKIVDGVVKNITSYGVFVDLGGIDGLLHITDISWGKAKHPSQVFKVGDRISAKILKFDKEENKISLGLKQIKPNPWDTAKEKYQVGSKITGKVIKIMDYGVFVEIEQGLEGLIHLSELGWSTARQATQRFNIGDTIEVKLIEIDSVNKKLSLSLKQLEPNLWDEMELKYPKGTRVRGIVKNITDFGVFIGIEEGIDGLIHISDIAWKKIKHPAEFFQKGQEVEAEVVSIDKEKKRFSLSTKLLQKDPWQKIEDKYHPGMSASGKVTNIANFGAFVEMEDGVEGIIHVAELHRWEKKGVIIKIGNTVEVEILNVDPQEKKIGLGLKGLVKTEEAANTNALNNA